MTENNESGDYGGTEGFPDGGYQTTQETLEIAKKYEAISGLDVRGFLAFYAGYKAGKAGNKGWRAYGIVGAGIQGYKAGKEAAEQPTFGQSLIASAKEALEWVKAQETLPPAKGGGVVQALTPEQQAEIDAPNPPGSSIVSQLFILESLVDVAAWHATEDHDDEAVSILAEDIKHAAMKLVDMCKGQGKAEHPSDPSALPLAINARAVADARAVLDSVGKAVAEGGLDEAVRVGSEGQGEDKEGKGTP